VLYQGEADEQARKSYVALAALNALESFVEVQEGASVVGLEVLFVASTGKLQLDSESVRFLSLLPQQKKASLFDLFSPVTELGQKLLKRDLVSPHCSVKLLGGRQELVELLVKGKGQEVRKLLKPLATLGRVGLAQAKK